MNIKNGRGIKNKELGEENRNRVFLYFVKNKGRTQADCSRDLGLSRLTVSKHIQNIKKYTFDNVSLYIDLPKMAQCFFDKFDIEKWDKIHKQFMLDGLNSDLLEEFNIDDFCSDEENVHRFALNDNAFYFFSNDIRGNLEMELYKFLENFFKQDI